LSCSLIKGKRIEYNPLLTLINQENFVADMGIQNHDFQWEGVDAGDRLVFFSYRENKALQGAID